MNTASTATGHIAAAIVLTIPDNQARTAYSTLRRLGLAIGGLRRADVIVLEDPAELGAFEAAVRQNEALFNENTHDLWAGPLEAPSPGELWIIDDRPERFVIGKLGHAVRFAGWRLEDAAGNPAAGEHLDEAARLLLCNPAVQRRILHVHDLPRGEYSAR